MLTSAHAQEACSAARPLHCLRARGDVRLSSELSPSLTHSPGAAPPAPRRGRSRGLCALPTRGSAGGRHHRHSRDSRGRSLPPRLYGKGGGRRARVCGCVRPDDGEAAAPQPLCSKRAPRRGLASPASPTRASCSVLGEAPARGGEPPGPSRPLAAPPPPSHAATAAVSFCATRRSCSLPPTRLRRRCVLRCDPPRWQQRALLVPLPASGPGATSCRRRGTLASRLATRCRPGRGAVRCLDGGSASGVDARSGARSGGVSGRVPAALPVPVCPRRSAAGLRAAAAASTPARRCYRACRGCSRCLCAAHARLGGRATPSPLVHQPRAPVTTPPR